MKKTFLMVKLNLIESLSGLLVSISLQLSGQDVHPVVRGSLQEVHRKPSAVSASADAQVPLQNLHHRATTSRDDHSVSASGPVLQLTCVGCERAAQTSSVQGRAREN